MFLHRESMTGVPFLSHLPTVAFCNPLFVVYCSAMPTARHFCACFSTFAVYFSTVVV